MGRKKRGEHNDSVISIFRKIRKGLIAIILVCIFLVASFWLVRFVSHLNTPLALYTYFRNTKENVPVWDGDSQMIIGVWLHQVDSSQLKNAVIVVNPVNREVHWLWLPEDVSLKDPHALAEYVHLPIDRYLVTQQPFAALHDTESTQNIVNSVVYDTVNGFDRYAKVFQTTRKANAYVYTNLMAREVFSLSELLQSSGEIIFLEWDTANNRQTIIADPAIVHSALRVWVRNTSSVPGLAGDTAQYIENIGFDVIRVDNVDCALISYISCDGEMSTVVSPEDIYLSYPFRRLAGLLQVKGVALEGESAENVDDFKRADIVVLLGSQ